MYYDLLRGEEQYVVVDIELEKVLLSIVSGNCHLEILQTMIEIINVLFSLFGRQKHASTVLVM
jgi:hypothetical protein